MFPKTWVRAIAALGHSADSKMFADSGPLSLNSQPLPIELADLNLDQPSDAFEALRRIAAEAPTMHGEAPEFHRA